MIPASVVALAGGAPPRLMDMSLPGSPSGATLAAVQRRKRKARDASQNPLRGCEELGLSAALG